VPEAELGLFARLFIAIDPDLGGRSHAKVQALSIGEQILFVQRLRRPDLKVVKLSHGVPKSRLKEKQQSGYTVGYTQVWDVMASDESV
jgi:hypothetical protein